MAELIKVCIDKQLTGATMVGAANHAMRESIANVPAVKFRPGLGVASPSPLQMAMFTGKKWKNGRTLKVRFLDGLQQVQDKVAQIAVMWSDFANIRFDFSNDPSAEIRVSFVPDGQSWSYIGTDCFSLAGHLPTMHYGWLNPDSTDEEYMRVVLHEFGHALGCIHEHQQPDSGIPWDPDAVYAYYMGDPNFWTKEQVDINIFQRYSKNETQFSAFDATSIMEYPVPNQLTLGDYEVGWNSTLSETDKIFMRASYPVVDVPPVVVPPEPPVTPDGGQTGSSTDGQAITDLAIDGDEGRGDIGGHGDQDLYRFVVQTPASYVMETTGPTDVVMVLLGPDSTTNVMGMDDDSGEDANARIIKALQPGTYLLRVTHVKPEGTGDYGVSVKTQA